MTDNPIAPTWTVDHLERFRIGIKEHIEQKSLQGFNDTEIAEFAAHAVQFIPSIGFKLNSETAKPLALLSMYDLAILIDDSSSMQCDEARYIRIRVQQQVLEIIAYVYCRSQINPRIKAIRFLNNGGDMNDVTERAATAKRPYNLYDGTTRIGTVLEKQILTPFVTSSMTRPLLVVVITDGDVEGEPVGHLETVIQNCVTRMQDKPHSVAFQFSRVGNNEGAVKLLKRLDELPGLSDYIDCQPANLTFRLVRNAVQNVNQVNMISKLMVGAITDLWDNWDDPDERW